MRMSTSFSQKIENFKEDFMAQNFKKLLKDNNITINALSYATHIGSTTLYYFRDDKCSLTAKKLNTLAEYFNVSTDYLLDKTDIPTVKETKRDISDREMNVLNLFNQLNIEQSEQIIKIMEQMICVNNTINAALNK